MENVLANRENGNNRSQRVVILPKRGGLTNPLIWHSGRLQSVLDNSAKTASLLSNNTHFRAVPEKLTHYKVDSKRPSIISLASGHESASPSGASQVDKDAIQTKNGSIECNDLKRSGEVAVTTSAKRANVLIDSGHKPAVKASKSRTSSRRARPNNTKVQPLLLPWRTEHRPTDWSLPVFDLTAKFDPYVSFDPERGAACGTPGGDETVETPANPVTHSQNIPNPNTSGRMKSSGGVFDFDLEDLKHYRRLNGYTLFVLVNKKKYEQGSICLPSDDLTEFVDGNKDNQKMLNRRWQALWSTLPEKSRREWKSKAKRVLKQLQQNSKREIWSENRRFKEFNRLEAQINRSQISSYNLLDLAAYFQLLSDRFAHFAKQVNDYEGPVDVASLESLLLDGLLTCLIPLIALAGEEDQVMSDSPDHKSICEGLTSLTFVAPF